MKSLLKRGYSDTLNSMQGIGYKELISCIKGDISLDAAVGLIKQNSRRYAKRQLTWFRRNEKLNLLNPETSTDDAIEIIKHHFNG